MENEEIIQFAKRMSQDILNKGDEVMPMCLIFKKDGNIEIIGMHFEGETSKEKMRNELKKYILNKEIDKYVVVFDAKMTAMDKDDKKSKPIVTDVILVGIYTAKEKLMKSFPYSEDKKLKDNEEVIVMTDRKGTHDSWDIWGEEMPYDADTNLEYQKLKRENRGLYIGLDKTEDKIHEVKTKGKLELINLPLKFRIEIYRYKGKAIFESFNAQNEVFFATTVVDDDDEFQAKINHVKIILTKLGKEFERR